VLLKNRGLDPRLEAQSSGELLRFVDETLADVYPHLVCQGGRRGFAKGKAPIDRSIDLLHAVAATKESTT
jgi:hypothetical protein